MITQRQIAHREIIEAINRGAIILTANKRLGAAIRREYERTNMDKGLEVWPTPQIFPWNVWLKNIWEEMIVSGVLVAPALLLTPQQELCIWQEIITKTLADKPLLQVSGAARQAQQAWQLMQAWQLELDKAQFSYNEDSKAFMKWAVEFEKLCLEKNWLSMSCLPDVLHHNAEIMQPGVTKELILSGFDELTPQQQCLLTAIRNCGCKISWLQFAGLQAKTVRVACNDSRHEADAAARWVRQCIDDNPVANIAIVVPELQSKRHIIIQALDAALLPQAINPAAQNMAQPYNISLGLPLSAYAIIETAIRLLGFLAPAIGLQDAGTILRSPFIRGWQQEAGARSLLDAYLRKQVGELEISIQTIRFYANKKNRAYYCPVLVNNIDVWNEAAKKSNYKATAAQWGEKFTALLKAFGWANGRPLSSEEYQTTQAWRELLVSFATLDIVTGILTASAAISQLRSMANERTYQPQTGNLPIQVLGVLEAEDLQFDALWVMGLNDSVWPPSPHANPFLPISIQHEAGLPHSSEDRELQVARRATQRLLSSAHDVIVSYPKRDGDNTLRVSSLISDIDEIKPGSLKISQQATWAEIIYDSADLESLEIDPAPPSDKMTARGGSSIIKNQANCPFRAFAENRLGAYAIEDAEIGLSPMVRGKLIHTILQNVWIKLKTQQQLLAMEPQALVELVRGISHQAVAEKTNRYQQTMMAKFKRIESERLCLRALQWLELEKQRPPFEVIAPEKEVFLSLNANTRIRLIIDRIDQLEDGRKLVIDYKTGMVSPAQWFSDRPEDPQLPLYSMAVNGNLAALAIAQVRAGEMAFKGVAEEANLLPKVNAFNNLRVKNIPDSWQAVLGKWANTINRLAEEFHDGKAAVDPKQADTCKKTYCNLQSLCRINELNTLNAVASEMEAK